MAISKILHMKDCGNKYHGKHLKLAIAYITNPDKTQNCRFVAAVNCQIGKAYEQMEETKKKFGKIDKRQGYHFILSFKEGEIAPEVAFELTGKFVDMYLKQKYEAVYVVHDNTDHIHSHIVINSVSFLDGKKYRYEKGDWAKVIQPITNKLCEEYGLSVIDIEEERDVTKARSRNYQEWKEYSDNEHTWSSMIKRDLDACIVEADSFEKFLQLLSDKGYAVKQGKYLSIMPQGMKRYRRTATLGENYTEEQIKRRISVEDLEFYQKHNPEQDPEILKVYVKRYRRAKMSKLQKKYYARLYRTGQLKKRPYSQVWKYHNDIKRLQKLQKEYLFIADNKINSVTELAALVSRLDEVKKAIARDKRAVLKEKNQYKSLFDIMTEMEALSVEKDCYLKGDDFFKDEYEKYDRLNEELMAQGYTFDELKALDNYYKAKLDDLRCKETNARTELKIGNTILNDIIAQAETERAITVNEKEKIRTIGSKQPLR